MSDHTEIVNLETATFSTAPQTGDDLTRATRLYIAKARYATSVGRHADAASHLERAQQYLDRAAEAYRVEDMIGRLEAELIVAAEEG